MKRCSACHELKAFSEFHKDQKRRDGHMYKCKECHKDYVRGWYQADTTRARAAQLKHRYELTPESYNALSAKQFGVCALCSQPPKGRPLFVDHNHETGAVRGLLCINCNTALGKLEANWERATKYLHGDLASSAATQEGLSVVGIE